LLQQEGWARNLSWRAVKQHFMEGRFKEGRAQTQEEYVFCISLSETKRRKHGGRGVDGAGRRMLLK